MAVVNCCKSPCHQKAAGYKGSLAKDHLNYLWLRRENDLYLNMIDPPIPLFRPEMFATYLSFAREMWHSGKTLLIHCNQGESRAPSLALLFLAKCLRILPNSSFDVARQQFLTLYPTYAPGQGLQTYLGANWADIDLM
jgi:hypothetical protein